MNWLVDAQLPPQSCQWLRAKGEQAIHVSDLENGLRLPDEMLWAYAREHRLVVLTKDNDFFERIILSEPPPQIVFITHRQLFQQSSLCHSRFGEYHCFCARCACFFTCARNHNNTTVAAIAIMPEAKRKVSIFSPLSFSHLR
jgi:predicted nuclease of predicted toxin-antitoxin system